MKLLTGFIGLVIFAISIPAASQSNDARLTFFNNFFPNPMCATPETKKIEIVKSVEGSIAENNLSWAQYSGIMNPSKKSMVESAMNSFMKNHCDEVERLRLMGVASANANNTAVNGAYNNYVAGVTAQNAARTTGPGATGARGGANNAGSRTADLRTGISAIGAAEKELKADAKKGEKAEGGAPAKDDKKPGDGGPAPVAATAPTKTDGQPAANTPAPAKPADPPIAITNDAMINAKAGTVTLTDGTVYTFDQASKTYKSPGKDSMDPDQMLVASGCSNGDNECQSALNYTQNIPEAALLAKGAAGSEGATAVDQSTAAQIAQFDSQLEAAKKQAQTALTQASGTGCVGPANNVIKALEAYGTAAKACNAKAATADNLCSMVRSPKAIVVQKLMSVGTLIINRQSSAADNCSAAQKFSRLAQTGLTVANVACTGVKYMCDSACATASQTWTVLEAANNTLLTCGGGLIVKGNPMIPVPATTAAGTELVRQGTNVQTAGNSIAPWIKSQKPVTTAKIAQCQKYEADIANMALQILSVVDANKAAKTCCKALNCDAGGGGGGGGTTNPVTMDQFCQTPGQAQNPPCLCRTQPTANGCPGALTTTTTTAAASNTSNGGGSKTTSTGGAAAMAGPGGISGFQTGNKTSGLSSAAKAALGITDDSGLTAEQAAAAAAAAGGLPGGADSSGGGYGGGGAGSLTKSQIDAAKKSDAAKKGMKGTFDDFAAAGFGSLNFGPDGKTTINGKKYTEEQVKKMIERKIASEEFHTQVTPASGVSNWDKVRVRYDENRGSLYP